MALTQTDLDRLEAALASGELTVEYDGQRVTYRSIEDLMRAIAYCRDALDAQGGGGQRVSYARFSRD